MYLKSNISTALYALINNFYQLCSPNHVVAPRRAVLLRHFETGGLQMEGPLCGNPRGAAAHSDRARECGASLVAARTCRPGKPAGSGAAFHVRVPAPPMEVVILPQ